ncbi:MAG: ABC transporter permease [Marinifilaceae bacterium]|jgi:ABC-2 type transport system permease protein|nr:ABC transporter permease [Marinifilaceae bacterium]
MNKILIIIKREFLTRARKKSFIILTLAVPILFALFYAFLIFMMVHDDKEVRNVAVINESTIEQPVTSTEYTKYKYLKDVNFEKEKNNLLEKDYYAVLYLPKDIIEKNEAELFSKMQVPMEVKNRISKQVSFKIENLKKNAILSKIGIPDLDKQLAATKTRIELKTLKLDVESGTAKESSSEILSILGMVGGFIIYMFILMYCTQVMRGVIEEKSNRIVEVIISSVKPFQLMIGKIIGIALVGLTQFLIWIVFIGILFIVGQLILMPNIDMETLRQTTDMAQLAQTSGMDIEQLNIASSLSKTLDPGMLSNYALYFLFFFIGGYLLYASLFAAIASAVDSETETNQFMTPLMIVMVAALYIGIAAMKNPESALAFWASVIPFSSPIVMLVRIPFGVPTWEIIVSMVSLIATVIALIALSAKIYRVGILMYGKKVTYKELWKWLRY